MSLLLTKTSKKVFPSKYKNQISCAHHYQGPNQTTKVNNSHEDPDDSQVFMDSSGLQGYGGLISK